VTSRKPVFAVAQDVISIPLMRTVPVGIGVSLSFDVSMFHQESPPLLLSFLLDLLLHSDLLITLVGVLPQIVLWTC
jgi:hypothetical protein